ncbi:DUF3263 domain-containing protein [Corynebacterium sp. A21]|uniref:DUF3263 domain-containing protein n=1 Tax=Corynebacterium sp. A21 TaxID=3457318 RepID=UPI003FD207A4
MPYSLGMPELADFDARLLTFESGAPRSLGAKEEAIRRELGISPVRYYQRLNLLIDAPAAMAAHPVLMARLRRIRDQRAEERAQADDR